MGSPEQGLPVRRTKLGRRSPSLESQPYSVCGWEQSGESISLAWALQRLLNGRLSANCSLGSRLMQMAYLHGCHKGCVGCYLISKTFIGCQFCTRTVLGATGDLESCFFIYLFTHSRMYWTIFIEGWPRPEHYSRWGMTYLNLLISCGDHFWNMYLTFSVPELKYFSGCSLECCKILRLQYHTYKLFHIWNSKFEIPHFKFSLMDIKFKSQGCRN